MSEAASLEVAQISLLEPLRRSGRNACQVREREWRIRRVGVESGGEGERVSVRCRGWMRVRHRACLNEGDGADNVGLEVLLERVDDTARGPIKGGRQGRQRSGA